jgi:hypothetical protein
MASSFNKFNCFVENVSVGVHNFTSSGTADLKIALTNSAPSASNTVLADITEISGGTGYTAGGAACAISSSGQTSGTYKLICSSPATWTASGAGMGPLRYAVLYNNTATGDALIGWWDYGSSPTLASGETFTVTLDGSAGVLQIV